MPTPLVLYDNYTRSLRSFEPLKVGDVGLYTCGPTVLFCETAYKAPARPASPAPTKMAESFKRVRLRPMQDAASSSSSRNTRRNRSGTPRWRSARDVR